MPPDSFPLHRPAAVTFDCWGTLIHEVDSGGGPGDRVKVFAGVTGVEEQQAANALAAAWRRHQVLWHRQVAFGAQDMTHMALATVGVTLDPASLAALVDTMATRGLQREVRALEGARATLERLAQLGVRRALICDTGYSSGYVVRQLLDRVGLLSLLEVTVFSDEVGVPKPHRTPFATALGGLGVAPERAVHVGDIRRSDIAGARAASMGSVRLKAYHDDPASGIAINAGVIDCVNAGCEPHCARPEADAVASSYADLLEILGYG
jgi:HAD superfamily hydrolase (TIGR01549 family)